MFCHQRSAAHSGCEVKRISRVLQVTGSNRTADIGGHADSAEAREVYEEVLQIPIMKLYRCRRPNDALVAIIRANTRLPDMALG